MPAALEIRDSSLADLPAIESLYPEAFPDEDLLPFVRDLLVDESVTTSLVGVIDSRIVGNVIFTLCGVEGGQADISLLAPLAVTPSRHGQGIGSELVRAGLQRLQDNGVSAVCVLGDPAFYGRLGFRRSTSIQPPYRLPAEYDGAWQSQDLGEAGPARSGVLTVPRQWQQRSLWSP